MKFCLAESLSLSQGQTEMKEEPCEQDKDGKSDLKQEGGRGWGKE